MNTQLGKASILAVGTELTTGQITNRNSPWISERLLPLGIEVVLHETVPDDRGMIQNALQHCAEMGQLIFVTGGLGPTTDDFTREVIAQWLNRPLEFQEIPWQAIVDRLEKRGIPVAESNRQQAYFPRGSTILPNPAGTAAGFSCPIQSGAGHLWAFPGPPSEVSAVWDQGIETKIREIIPARPPSTLFTWQCMGKSESDLGELTEKALLGSQLKTGYRVHIPFVEIKVWCPGDEVENKGPWFQKLEAVLAPWVITRQGEDLAARLLHQLQRNEDIKIIDIASGGILAHRIGNLLRKPQYAPQAPGITLTTEWNFPQQPDPWVSQVLDQANQQDDSITLVLAGFTPDGQGTVGLREGQRIYQDQIQSPFRKIEFLDRTQSYSVEMALKRWCEWLNTSTS